MENKKPQAIILDPASISRLPQESFTETDRGVVTWQTLISAPTTASDSLTAGIATCPPKHGHLCIHQHKQAEIYHVTQGRGIVSIDGVEHAVEAGSVVYIPGDAEHGIRNEDPEEDLKWLYIFPTDGFGDVVYRFKD